MQPIEIFEPLPGGGARLTGRADFQPRPAPARGLHRAPIAATFRLAHRRRRRAFVASTPL